MTDYLAELRRTGAAYKRAREKADKIMEQPRADLTEAVRTAYKAGRRKADILRDIGGAWSRQWLDDTVRDIDPPGGRIARKPGTPKTGD